MSASGATQRGTAAGRVGRRADSQRDHEGVYGWPGERDERHGGTERKHHASPDGPSPEADEATRVV